MLRQRTSVSFTDAERARIRRIADRLGVSASDVLRLGLHELEVRHGAEGLIIGEQGSHHTKVQA